VAYTAAEAAAAPAIAPAMAAALPAVDLRPRPFPPDFDPPPDPLGRPRLRPDRPLPGLMVSEAETPEEGSKNNKLGFFFSSSKSLYQSKEQQVI